MIYYFIKNIFKPKPKKVNAVAIIEDPLWLKLAFGEIGVQEIKGIQHELRILEYHSMTDGKFNSDEISWCSSFVCWCFEKSGIPSTKNGLARSWIKWGLPIATPRRGCVVTLWRISPSSWAGHVGLLIEEKGDYVYLLSGNTDDKVCIERFPKEQVLSYNWPKLD